MSTPLNSSRRQWLSLVGKTGVAGLALSSLPVYARSSSAHVIVVGGGFGGATAARYLKRGDPSLKVTLIEPARTFYTCPFSNLYLAGLRRFEQQGHGFDDLKAAGIDVIHDYATAVDADAKSITLAKGNKLSYDKLLLSPIRLNDRRPKVLSYRHQGWLAWFYHPACGIIGIHSVNAKLYKTTGNRRFTTANTTG